MSRSISSLRTKHRRRSAFTLIEMVIVLTIAGIALAMAFNKVDFTRFKADAAVSLVRATLQKAQRDAITHQFNVIVSFDTVAQQIRIVWDANNDGQISTGERVLTTTLDLGNRFATPSAGVNGVVTSAIFGSSVGTLTSLPTVTFRRDGSLSTNLEIYISTAGHTGTLPNFRAITIMQATGRSTWYRFNRQNSTWVPAAL